jgi:cell division protein FtsB
MLFLGGIPLFAEETEVIDDEEYVFVKKEALVKIRDWCIEAKAQLEKLVMENAALQMENQSLKQQVEYLKSGLYVGMNTGYPFPSGDAILMYKFEKSGIYSLFGYHDRFSIQLGYMRRVK